MPKHDIRKILAKYRFAKKKPQQNKIHVWLFHQPVMYLPTTVTFPVLMLSPFWLAATHVYRPASTMLTPTIFRYPLDNNWAPFWFPSVIGRLSFPPFFSQLIIGTGAASGMQGIVRLPLFAARIVLGRGFLAKDGLNATKKIFYQCEILIWLKSAILLDDCLTIWCLD